MTGGGHKPYIKNPLCPPPRCRLSSPWINTATIGCSNMTTPRASCTPSRASHTLHRISCSSRWIPPPPLNPCPTTSPQSNATRALLSTWLLQGVISPKRGFTVVVLHRGACEWRIPGSLPFAAQCISSTMIFFNVLSVLELRFTLPSNAVIMRGVMPVTFLPTWAFTWKIQNLDMARENWDILGKRFDTMMAKWKEMKINVLKNDELEEYLKAKEAVAGKLSVTSPPPGVFNFGGSPNNQTPPPMEIQQKQPQQPPVFTFTAAAASFLTTANTIAASPAHQTKPPSPQPPAAMPASIPVSAPTSPQPPPAPTNAPPAPAAAPPPKPPSPQTPAVNGAAGATPAKPTSALPPLPTNTTAPAAAPPPKPPSPQPSPSEVPALAPVVAPPSKSTTSPQSSPAVMATPSPTPLAPGGPAPPPPSPRPTTGQLCLPQKPGGRRGETPESASSRSTSESTGSPERSTASSSDTTAATGDPRTTEEATEQAYTEQSQQSLTMDTFFDPSASEMDRITFLKAFLLDHSVEWRQRDAGWLARSYAERCRDIYRIICVWMKSTEVVLGNYFTSQQYLPFCEMLWSERCFRDVANETSTTISARYLAIEFIFVLQRALVRHDERNQKLFLSATPESFAVYWTILLQTSVLFSRSKTITRKSINCLKLKSSCSL